MKNIKSKIGNAILLIALVILTFYVIFKNNDMEVILQNITQVDIKFIFMGLGIMFLFVLGEAMNLHVVLKSLGEPIHLLQTFKYALVGFFFSSITPSSTGGQPLQVYFMTKDKIPVSHSLVALIVELFSFQVASCVLAWLGIIFSYDLLVASIGKIKYLLILGLTVNFLLVSGLLILLFSKKIALKLNHGLYAILRFIHFKKADNVYNSILKQIDEYHDSALFLKNHKSIIVKTILISFGKLFLYHSIPYFVYLAFGLHDFTILDFVWMQAVLYISVSSLPFPGAVGVSEGSFVILFKLLFPEAILSSAMLLSRGISFYIFVLITGLLILGFILAHKLKAKN
ncbi:MAG: flippase-like domain-containing protein [Bacilli bacterium]|nr:flippase-like domain-containing protein [Bacilli bacterium]